MGKVRGRPISPVLRAWPKADRRRKLAALINSCDGSLLRVAHRLRVHRSSMYRYCYEYDLWPVFNAVRKDVIEKRAEAKRKKYRGHGVHT